ncbi:transposase [Reyranella sp.]|uniref:transposase n=1 Tax=Reyranella sp. TaxID=1929291 RepID=UPI00387E3898
MTTVAVLSGPERRRRWSASQKAQIVEESLASGAVAEVTRRHDVHPNLTGGPRWAAIRARHPHQGPLPEGGGHLLQNFRP